MYLMRANWVLLKHLDRGGSGEAWVGLGLSFGECGTLLRKQLARAQAGSS